MDSKIDIILTKLESLDKLDKVLKDTDQIKSDLKKTQEEMIAMNTKITSLQNENETQRKKVATLEAKVDYLENQSRRCNLVFRGVLEEKKESWTESKNKILTIVNDMGIVINSREIERAHRTPSKTSPRPIVAKFYSYEMKETILKTAKSLKIKWPNVSIMEDFSKSIIDDRRKLVERMKAERKKGNYAQIRFNKLQIEENIFMYNRETNAIEWTGKGKKPEKKQPNKEEEEKLMAKRKREERKASSDSPSQPNKIGKGVEETEKLDTSENEYHTDEDEFLTRNNQQENK